MPKLTVEERTQILEQRLGITFANPGLALDAVTHKSYLNEHRDEAAADNERLEFLGDAVVDLVISHRLMEKFPNANEGELSKLRALIVHEEGLARVARQLGLGELLRLGRGEELSGGGEKSSVLADALEAVVGAVYLSEGFARVQELMDREFAEALAGVAEGRNGSDFKTRLQELIQTQKKPSPRYRVVAEHGPDHAKLFEVEVSVAGVPLAQAAGKNKKEAEQAAARVALEQLKRFDPNEGDE